MNTPNPNNTTAVFALVALAVLARVVVYFVTNYQVDDALITFRYAENLAAGNGFVYNIGERVCGTTTPLFTLLLAGLAVLGIPVPSAAITISVICAGVTTFALARFGQESGAGATAFLPAILYSLYPRSLISDISGLETALFTMLIVLTMYQLIRRHYNTAAIAAGVAALTRPEGIGLVAVVMFVALVERVPRIWKVFAFPFVLISGWLVFAYSYFGTAIPNSLSAKAVLYQKAGTDVFGRVGELMTLGPDLGLLAFGVLICLTIWLAIKQDRIAWIGLTAIGLVAGLAIFPPRIFYWYAAPGLPLIFVVIARCCAMLGRRFKLRGIMLFISIAIAISLAFVSCAKISALNSEMAWYSSNHIAAAEYLNAHADANDTVLAEDIGHFGYHFRGKIIDRDGLVSPQVIEYNRRNDQLAFADSIKPDWIFIARDYPTSQPILNSQLLRERYWQIDYDGPTSEETHLLYRRQH